MNPIDDASLDRLFREGRTFNHYLDKAVGEDEIRAIWDLMKMPPTSTNQSPARMVWCLSAEAKEKLASCASDSNADKIRHAPAAVVIGMDENFHEHLPQLFPHTDAKSWFEGDLEKRRGSAMQSSSLQGAYLILAARALGLDTGPMAGFDKAKVDAAFFADQPGVWSNFIATLGYGDRSKLHPRNPRLAFEQANRIA